VARPRASTSGGQCAGRVAVSVSGFGFDSGERKPVPEARAAIISAVDFLGGVVLVLPAGAVGRQLRKAVQILQGLPSGPRTMPGGREGLGGAGPGLGGGGG
jgi:hypothetical protein